ncbi:MAG: AI-2E family transporter [Vicinamibacterales bacterium]
MSSDRHAVSLSAQSITLFVALAIGIYLSWIVIQPFLSVLAWAAVLSILFYPVHALIKARWPAHPAAAALLSTFLVGVVILLPAALIITAAVSELRNVTEGMPVTLVGWVDPANPLTGQAVQFIERFVSLRPLRDPDFVASALRGLSGGAASGGLRIVGGAINALVGMALAVFTMFFLFKDAQLVKTSWYDLVPIENRRLRALFVRTRNVINASVYGTLLLSVIQGALGGVAFLVLGLPSPFLWGVVMALASIIPVLGAFVVWVPAALYLLANGQIWQGIVLIAWGSVIIGMADNLLRPVLVGSRTRMHELLVLFGVLGGVSAFGLLGIVLGPVIFAVTLALVEAARDIGTSDDGADEAVVANR